MDLKFTDSLGPLLVGNGLFRRQCEVNWSWENYSCPIRSTHGNRWAIANLDYKDTRQCITKPGDITALHETLLAEGEL